MIFSEFEVWSFLLILGTLLFSMLIASTLKRTFKFLEKSLIPVSVLGGIILLVISTIVYFATGDYLFNLPIYSPNEFTYNGMEVLELITYHSLGIGFIAMGMRFSDRKFTKQRSVEIFDSGVTTVNGYLLQVFIGMVIVMIAMYVFNVDGLIEAAGILLAFGFGQGTGQALNFGAIYEQAGLEGGANFGLTIAALGFLVACIGGVIYINVMHRKGKIVIDNTEQAMGLADYEDTNEMAVVSSMDKFTVQFALVLVVYVISYFIMMGLSALLPSFELTLFGFNFFIGTLLTLPTKAIISKLYQKKIIKRKIVNNFMMNRIGGFAFDLMIVSGIAAIQLPLLAEHWALLLIMGAFGAVATFLYIYFVSKTLHRSYMHEQFLAMFGMLTGTASTGMILLREIDGSYKTPASENLVYQTLPAMIFGFPLMLLAPVADDGTSQALLVFGIVVVLLVAFNIILFRSKIFKKRKKATESSEN